MKIIREFIDYDWWYVYFDITTMQIKRNPNDSKKPTYKTI